MKKQFAIKPAQVVKAISNSIAKAESANVLKFLGDTPRCCSEWDLGPSGKIVATR
ncbi:hypothetical protein [Spirosoma fluviale]|uniref:Uncharacterized protein n=1 Tax=Spirosoma fluviale TaxID=1597977 RepID=A0A286FYF5_9BACT|nr:hypothetical protein [Spirosoma fluviale]SOD88321.1 hypothetical protein SAMN06269250_2609 [Spirosoma fluviale]